jgi:uncharacterized membrane protein YcaP (DUF421 family)
MGLDSAIKREMDMIMFFNGWDGIIRVLVVGILAYVALVFLLRVMGKRTLSKMNAFDLVVTVAIGSMLANIFLSPDVALLEGVLGMGLLIMLQYVIAWLSVRVPKFAKLVKAQPVLLYYGDQFIQDMMKRERVLEAEIQAAVRAQGKADMEDVLGVVLETDGSFTVISKDSHKTLSALESVAPLSRFDDVIEKEQARDKGTK